MAQNQSDLELPRFPALSLRIPACGIAYFRACRAALFFPGLGMRIRCRHTRPEAPEELANRFVIVLFGSIFAATATDTTLRPLYAGDNDGCVEKVGCVKLSGAMEIV